MYKNLSKQTLFNTKKTLSKRKLKFQWYGEIEDNEDSFTLFSGYTAVGKVRHTVQ